MNRTHSRIIAALALLICGTPAFADFVPETTEPQKQESDAATRDNDVAADTRSDTHEKYSTPMLTTALPNNEPVTTPAPAPRAIKPVFHTDKPHLSPGTSPRKRDDRPAFGAGQSRMTGEANSGRKTAHDRFANVEASYLLKKKAR